MISNADIEAIQNQADIVEIISGYVPLTRKGKEYVGVCPFHDDHDPSMRVSPQKQIFKCFVCGTGGTVFSFVSKMEQISFQEAVAVVAKKIGYTLTSQPTRTKVVREVPHQKALDALKEFCDFCNYNLYSQQGTPALQYLRSRKFSDEVINRYQIGFAPSSEAQMRFFEAKHMDVKDLVEAGLLADTMDLSLAMFVNRIIIPIRDEKGNIVGITARILPGLSGPKYLNTTNTPVFEKGKLLFNFDLAKDAARKAGRFILCEGAMDVLGLAKAGMEEGIAALGTAITDEQLALVSKTRLPVTVFYDADQAGRNAVWKFGQLALKRNIPFSVVMQSAAKDPDDIFMESGAEGLKNIVSKTVSFVDFAFEYLQSQYDLDNYEDRQKYAALLSGLIAQNVSPYEAAVYYKRLEELSGFDYSSALTQSKGKKRDFKAVDTSPLIRPEQGRKQAEYSVLTAMLYGYGYVEAFKDEVGFFSDPDCHALSLYLYESYRKRESIDALELMDALEEEPLRNLLVELYDREASHYTSQQFFWDALIKLKESAIKEQLDLIDSQIASAATVGEKLSLAKTKKELIQKKNELRRRKEV